MKNKEKHYCQLPKLKVAGSNLVARSKSNKPECFTFRLFFLAFSGFSNVTYICNNSPVAF